MILCIIIEGKNAVHTLQVIIWISFKLSLKLKILFAVNLWRHRKTAKDNIIIELKFLTNKYFNVAPKSIWNLP